MEVVEFAMLLRKKAALICLAGSLTAAPRVCIAADNGDAAARAEENFRKHGEECSALASLWEGKKAEMQHPVERLVLPLEYWPDGRVKARLIAEKAQMLGLMEHVFAEGVRVELIGEDGGDDGFLLAEDCLFDRKSKKGFCKGKVVMVKGGDRVEGEGMYFSAEGRFVRILSGARIRTSRFKGSFGRMK